MNWTPQLILAVAHYVIAVAALGCLLGFGVVDANGPAATALYVLIGTGVGGALALVSPTPAAPPSPPPTVATFETATHNAPVVAEPAP